MSKPNLLYKAMKASWMLDPVTAISAAKVLETMIGAARLKAAYPAIEYVEDEDEYEEEVNNTHYHYRLTHKDYAAIPQGKQISVVRLEGVMMRDEAWCEPGTRDIAKWLRQGDADPRVLANIVLIDSGGGAADSVKDLADAITACQKPVLAFCDGDMCSAAYYAGCYADHIMANDGRNRVGCIGTMVQLVGYPAKAKDENGYTRLRIYADGSEDKNSEYEQALEGNFELIKRNVLNPLAEDFRNDVKTRRPSTTDEQRKGRTFYAQDVVGTLIDSIGSLKDAVKQALDLSTNTISEMKGHENLQSLDTCRDLQMVDGYVSLNGEQLAEIDKAIGEGRTEKALRETDQKTITEQATTIDNLTQERDELKPKAEQLEAKDAEIASLTQERDNLKEENAKKDARIAELEKALDKDPDDEEAMQAMHNGDHANNDGKFHEPTDEEAMESARKALRQGKN
ncbi:MAG: S49 family peptidase [Bacteroidales bacterium]|nr:S49 family peptidase [Bacteroidales bacterium]